MKKTVVLILIIAMLLPTLAVADVGFNDVPEDSWAVGEIDSAVNYGLIEGMGNGQFGYGKTISRAEFVTILSRMFEYDTQIAGSSFSDVSESSWYRPYIEAALKNGVIDENTKFNPDDPITRRDMAVMLIRALGYKGIAENAAGYEIPFDDVTKDRGYITVAYDLGIIKGTSSTTFAPENTAKREEAAAMLVRVYEKLKGDTEWLHGFYAFSSYSQRSLISDMDAVSAGWSTMNFSLERGAWLNTGYTDDNYWAIPESYEDIVSYLEAYSTPLNLNVYMDTSDKITLFDGSSTSALNYMLTSANYRSQAIKAIVSEVTRTYEKIGKNPYSGVTIDFEGLKGESVKSGFNAFLVELSSQLKDLDMSLYVAVQPVLDSGEYYDGFDYKMIGQVADKVILMAHDYNARSMDGFVGSEYYKTSALTPINKVYYSLRKILDQDTGVQDASKVAIAISFSSIGWQIDENGKLLSETCIQPGGSTLSARMAQEDTEFGWSEEYKNPYIIYRDDDGNRWFVYYENSRSVNEKITLARMFGITGVSVWRLGTVPQFDNYTVDFS